MLEPTAQQFSLVQKKMCAPDNADYASRFGWRNVRSILQSFPIRSTAFVFSQMRHKLLRSRTRGESIENVQKRSETMVV